jgi:histone acetyltransferase (RNA polymerase elongator complex component)
MRDLGVQTVELGVQSMDDGVLALSRRGHGSEDTVRGVQVLKRFGFKVGIQLMPGLPGDSEQKFRDTVDQVIRLRPDMVRLYPAVVLRITELGRWYREGRYQPLSLETAVEICAESCMRLEAEGISVIRIGLMSTPSLLKKDQIIGGPWHPAFGFLVRSAIHQKKIDPHLPRPGEISEFRILAPKREIPLVRGYKNEGLLAIEKKIGAKIIEVLPDDGLDSGHIRVEAV